MQHDADLNSHMQQLPILEQVRVFNIMLFKSTSSEIPGDTEIMLMGYGTYKSMQNNLKNTSVPTLFITYYWHYQNGLGLSYKIKRNSPSRRTVSLNSK